MMVRFFFAVFHVFVIRICHIPPLITFSTINNVLISIKISNFTLKVYFKGACLTGDEKNFAGLSSLT